MRSATNYVVFNHVFFNNTHFGLFIFFQNLHILLLYMKLSYQITGLWYSHSSRYFPNSFDGVVLSKETKNNLLKWKQQGEFPNILMCSRPGTGKTTLAKVIAKQFECDYLYINASDEGNVETIRNKVKDFAMTASFNGKMKLVILDEADGFANIQSQKILRALMEEVVDTCRFVITANYRHKIIEPIISRCVELDMNPPKLGIVQKCVQILKEQGVSYSMEQIRKLPQIVNSFYPDIRSVIKTLQNCVDENNNFSITNFNTDQVFVSKLVDELLKNKNAISARQFVIENQAKFGCDYSRLLMQLYKYIIDKSNLNHQLKAKWVISVAQYLYRMTSSVDSQICMAACLAQMVIKLK